MKKIILSSIFILSAFMLKAQETALAPDQNPNFKMSLAKYQSSQESLQGTMNTTVQDTYKAYDWYQAKLERRQQRISFRQERALARIRYRNDYQGNWDYGYRYNNYYSPFSYRHGWWCR